MTIDTLKNHWFWKYGIGKNRIFEDLKNINFKIWICAKVFYTSLFIIIINNFFDIEGFIQNPMTHPEWAISWVSLLPEIPWQIIFIVLCFFSNLITLVNTHKKSYRILNFIIFFFLFSSLNSYPKISHNLHTALIPLFFLCFITFKEDKKIQNALIYASAIGSILISYSLAGLWKILTGIKHLIKGDHGNFDFDAMTRYIKYNFVYSTPNEIANWLIENEWIGFLSLWFAILVEFVAISVIFHPKLQKALGALLMLMHIGAANILEVPFRYMFISIVPLLILTPFSKNSLSFNEM